MRRFAIAVILAAMLVPAPARAGGAGGCGGSTTHASAAGSAQVVLHGSCMVPTVLRVAPGATVNWISKDPYPHTVTAGAAGLWPEAELTQEGARTFSFRFAARGVFPYYCRYHANMGGAIVVGDGITTPTSSGAATDSTGASPGWPVAAVLGLAAGSVGFVVGRRARALRGQREP